MKIVITGAGKGIGLEVARILAADGHTVVAISRNVTVLKSLGVPNIHPLQFDLNHITEYPRLVAEIQKHIAEVNVLLNNAGYLVKKEHELLSPQDFDSMYNTNVKAPFFLIQSLRPLLGKGSHIVNIGSMGGLTNTAKFPGMSLYSSSKAALAVLTECLATELKTSGIYSNCLALGAANTEMVKQAFPDYQTPVSAAQMGSYVAWFCLNGTKWFNGQVLPVAMSTP